MANFNLSTSIGQCQNFWLEAIKQNGIIKNTDGTISVYLKNSNNIKTPYEVTKTCCSVLNDITNQGYFYDLNAQKCRWSAQSALDCGFDKPFKIVLNPVGNDGAIFNVTEDEISNLVIDFDYLFKFDCESLSQKISQVKPINPDLTKNIKIIENKILEQEVKCEEISSRLAYNENLFNNTRYSINCDLFTASNNNATVNNQTIPTQSTIVKTQINSGATIPVTTPITAPAISFLGRVDLANLLNPNPFSNPSFINTRIPISNLFVPQTPTISIRPGILNTFSGFSQIQTTPTFSIRPDLINFTGFSATPTATTITPILNVPRIPITAIPKAPITNTPLRQVLINPLPQGKQIVPFTRTGFGTGFTFGSVAPFSFALGSSIGNTSNGNFCLTEPAGLTEWESVLGADRFNRFINGDVDSYSCRDVYLMYYNTNSAQLIYTCDTPFGSKTKIQQEIDKIKLEQQACQIAIDDLNNALQALKSVQVVDVDICGTPISVLENLSVTVTLDVVNSSGYLTTVFEYDLFNQIGAGNLYNYLVSTRDNSGFFVCGEPNQTEIWASGCTALIYPEFSGVTIPESNIPPTNVTSCSKIKDYFSNALFIESSLSGQSNGLSVFQGSLSPTTFSSNWLHSTQAIDDENIINLIKNQKIKVSIKVNTNCGDLCVLIDHITLEKNTTIVDGQNIILTKSPGFKLTRIIDNKKSWLNSSDLTNRIFEINDVNDGNSIRQTDYDVNDERLIINSKEIDLDINIANGIETDFWNYASNNLCLFTGRTNFFNCNDAYNYYKQFQDGFCFQYQDGIIYTFMDDEKVILAHEGEVPKDFQDNEDDDFDFQDSILYTFNGPPYITAKCGDDLLDFGSLISTEISTINTIQNFNNFMTSEFIDAKNRQTIIGYGTLRALYERYLNSTLYCGTQSHAFDYVSMNTFAGLLNNYWIDIIEQVIPATTIWGSVKVYRNTIFDEQKYKYRSYTSLFKKSDFSGVTAPSPIFDTFGMCSPAEVITTIVNRKNSIVKNTTSTKYDYINLVQLNTSSEFIGTITITKEAI